MASQKTISECDKTLDEIGAMLIEKNGWSEDAPRVSVADLVREFTPNSDDEEEIGRVRQLLNAQGIGAWGATGKASLGTYLAMCANQAYRDGLIEQTPVGEEEPDWLLVHAAVMLAWKAAPAERRGKHPFAPRVERRMAADLANKQAPENTNARVSVQHSYGRMPADGHTIALARWEELRATAAVIEVDGAAVATQAAYAPVTQKAARPPSQQMDLPLPGLKGAADLRLQLIELLTVAGYNRQQPLPVDVATVLSLASALSGAMTIEVDRLAQWMVGLDHPPADSRQAGQWRQRAWDALNWCNLRLQTPAGHYLPLVRVDTGGNLPEGLVTLWPYDWSRRRGQWMLSGHLTHQVQRIKSYRGGALAQLTMGSEDVLRSSNRYSGSDVRPRLLVSDKPAGPGPWSQWMPYPQLFARAGLYYDWSTRKGRGQAKDLFGRLADALQQGGYVVPSDAQSRQAEAGDTVEFQIMPARGGRGQIQKIRLRASDRLMEAYRLMARGAGTGLGDRPLTEVMKI